ncbi:MAG: class I SAM-dependent methyltransferase [Promethearchaeota archaeon]
MTERAMKPFGLALKDFYSGKKRVKVIFYRDDGLKTKLSIKPFFRSPNDFSNLEKQAIELCQGRVLDIGAGVGPHSLELQKLGLEVYAIDISPQACEIMSSRGIRNVRCTNIYNLDMEIFDTILLLGRSIGFVEDLNGMKRFLNYCKNLLNPSGIILFDSIDIRVTTKQIHLDYHERNRKMGKYIGEVGCQMKYKGKYGDKFQLLHIDPDTLKDCIQELGMLCEILIKEDNGNYLAKISMQN